MTEVPKIVHERLRAAAVQTGPGQNAAELKHPDADLLTAFAEQSLSATERESLLEHLTGCGDCREVVMLALPESDAIVPVAAETEAQPATATTIKIKASGGWLRSGAFSSANLFSWANLRWATLAAAVVVIAAVLTLRPGSHDKNEAKLTPAAPLASAPADGERQIAMATPPQDLAKEEFFKGDLADRERSVPQTPSVLKPEDKQFVSNLDLKANRDVRPAAKQALSPAPPAATPTEYGMLLADNVNGRKKDSERADRPLTAGASGAAIANGASTGRNTAMVEIESAAATVPPEPSVVGGLKERDEVAAVEKAKPATQELEANATASNEAQKTPVADVPNAPRYTSGDFAYQRAGLSNLSKAATLPKATWAITAGVLQRSFDEGRTWQRALQADHSLQCYASSGLNVWAGGQAGTLLHSTDGGATWTKVHPSFREQTLTSDVTHIDAPAAGKITVSAGDNGIEIWSSADNGLTWDKK